MNKYFKNKKLAFSFIIVFLMVFNSVLLLPLYAYAEEEISTESISDKREGDNALNSDATECVVGKDIRMTNLIVLENGFYAIVDETENTELNTQDIQFPILQGFPDKTKTKYFTYRIFDHNGNFMVNLTTAVTGLYSHVDSGSSKMLNISGSFSGAYANNISYSAVLNGSTGTIYLYYRGINAGAIKYRIYTNGYIGDI